MTKTVQLNRGEATALIFNIPDSNNTLAGKRVTFSIGKYKKSPGLLHKASALPGSSADVIITSQTASLITGTIQITQGMVDSIEMPAMRQVTIRFTPSGGWN